MHKKGILPMVVFGREAKMERIPMDWTELFCHVDDFCQQFEPAWHRQQLESGQRKRRRSSRLTSSEIMTILIMFHASNYRTFKHFYRRVQREHAEDFPRLVSYSRFVELMPSVLAPPVCVLAVAIRSQHRHCVRRFHRLGSLQEQTHQSAPCFSRHCPARKNNHGLVFRLQIAPGDQRARRVAVGPTDGRQRR